MRLSNYLFFTTDCEQALTFYASCGLGDVVLVVRHGDNGTLFRTESLRGKIQVFVQTTDGRINVLDRNNGRLMRTIEPPFKAALAANLLVGSSTLFESLSRTTSGGAPTLVAFGA